MILIPERYEMFDLKSLNWWIPPRSWENEELFQIIRSKGVNGIRRHFSSDPVVAQNTVYFDRMRMNAQYCADNGMYIIFDFYSKEIKAASGGLAAMRWQWQMPESQFLAMWRTMARELKDYKNVCLELGNEPNDAGMSDPYPEHRDIWMARCVKAIEAIRAEGFEGMIVIPFPEVATYGQSGLDWRDRIIAADPLDRWMWDFHEYWYWQHRNSNQTSPQDVRAWLQSKKIAELRAMGDRVLCGEFGTHTQNPDSRDTAYFKSQITVFKADGYDYCGQSYQAGNDFPMLTGPINQQWTELNPTGEYFVSQIGDLQYFNDEDGEMPTIYDEVYNTTTTLPVEINGRTGDPELAVITIPPEDVPEIEEAVLIITLFDQVKSEDGGRFAINDNPDQELPESGNAQNSNRELWQKTFDIPIDPSQLITGDNIIHFFYTNTNPTWGYTVETLELGVNYRDEPLETTTTSTTTTTTSPPPTTPPQNDFVTREEFEELEEQVHRNVLNISGLARLVGEQGAEIIDISRRVNLLENFATDAERSIRDLEITDNELLAMIQRIEVSLAKVKQCVLNSL